MLLNPSSPMPLYQQLAERLRGQLEERSWAEGARIPSEHELAEQFGVGRPTVRQATDVLVRMGLLERRRGSGTFVSKAPAAVDLFSLTGSSAAFGEQGLQAEVTLIAGLRREWIEAPEHPLTGLEVYRCSRRTAVDGMPVLLEDICLDARVFSGLERFSMEGRSLSALVREAYFMVPESAYQTFRVGVPSAEDAGLLEVPAGTMVLMVHRRLSFPGAPHAIVVDMHCRTDTYVFSQTLAAPSSPGSPAGAQIR